MQVQSQLKKHIVECIKKENVLLAHYSLKMLLELLADNLKTIG